MRALWAPVLVNLAYFLVGLGLLRISGVIDHVLSPRALAAGGLAYLVGIAAVLPLCVLVLVVGGSVNLVVFGALAAGLAAPALRDLGQGLRRDVRSGLRWTGRGLAAIRNDLGNSGPAGWILLAMVLALVALALVGLVTLGNRPIGASGETDAWHNWAFRGRLLFFDTHLPTGILGFSGDVRPEPHYTINPRYPLLLPLLEALDFRALGRADTAAIHTVLWLIAIAFVWAAGFLSAQTTRVQVWLPVLAGAVMLSLSSLLSGYADVPLAYYLCLAALATGLWLRSGERRQLVVALVLMAGASGLKDEGIAGSTVILVAAAAVLGLAREREAVRRGLRDLALGAAAMLAVAVVPWQVWAYSHGLETEVPAGRYLRPGFLAQHVSRLWPPVRALSAQLSAPTHLTLFVAPAVALALVLVWERRKRALAAFYLLAGSGYLVTLLGSYWINTTPISWLLKTTASRVVTVPALMAVAAILQLSAGASPLTSIGSGRRRLGRERPAGAE